MKFYRAVWSSHPIDRPHNIPITCHTPSLAFYRHVWDTSGTGHDHGTQVKQQRSGKPNRTTEARQSGAGPIRGAKLARGKRCMYRRNKGNGTWLLKVSDGHGKPWTKAFASADDFDESDARTSDLLRGAGQLRRS